MTPTSRVAAVLFLLFTGVGATLPALPLAVRDLGASPRALGLVLGVFPFAALLGRVVAGRSTDRRGRVFTLRAGTGCAALAGALLTLPLPVAGLVAARLLHGLADALTYTAVAAYVLDRTEPVRRPQALALVGSGLWAGYAIGPLIGAALGLQAVGLVVVGTSALALALTVGLPRDAARVRGPTGLRALLPRGVAFPGTALGLGNLGYAAVVGFLVVHLDDRGARGAWALTAFSVAVLFGRLLVVPLAVRLGILRVLPYAMTAMAAGLLVLGATSSTVVAMVAAVGVGLGYCLPFPALVALVAGRVPEAQRGAAVGALTAFYDVFVGVGSVVFGLLADARSTAAVFVVAAVGVLAAGALDAVLASRSSGGAALVDTTPDA